MPLSQHQLITLRKIRDGKRHMMRGDRAYGIEVRYEIASRGRDDINCRSLAPLMRNGFIGFKTKPTDMTRYYDVKLMPQGIKALSGANQ